MMKRFVPVLLTVVVLCVLALVSGVEALLLIPLPGGLPLGTLFAILALVAGAAVPLAVSRPGSLLRWVGAIALVAAVLWFPVGAYLSGNAELNFVVDAANSALFWHLTAAVAVLVLGTMLWAGVEAIWKRRKPA